VGDWLWTVAMRDLMAAVPGVSHVVLVPAGEVNPAAHGPAGHTIPPGQVGLGSTATGQRGAVPPGRPVLRSDQAVGQQCLQLDAEASAEVTVISG
jgi:hypothetical protein